MEYPHTAMGRVEFQVSLPEFRGWSSNKRTSFSIPTSVFPCQCDSTNFPRRTYGNIAINSVVK